MKLVTVAATALAMLASEASAQSKGLKDRLLGAWHFVIAEVTAPDGQKSFPFGPKPRGILIFTPEALRGMVERDIDRYGKLVREVGMKAE